MPFLKAVRPEQILRYEPQIHPNSFSTASLGVVLAGARSPTIIAGRKCSGQKSWEVPTHSQQKMKVWLLLLLLGVL